MTRKSSIWLKLIVSDVIMSVCVVANSCWYIQSPHPASLLAIAVAGLAMVFVTCRYFLLLRKYN